MTGVLARGNVVLYAVTMFVSAFLLFLVQPMYTKSVLPLLGGAPSVWNTTLVFFQATLLAGYLYAHLLPKISARGHPLLHLMLVGAVLLFLPVSLSETWTPPVDRSPVLWLLGVSISTVGLPFFVLASTAPLLQRWFAATDAPGASDPYFLYSASNAGSLLALLAYPILVEPSLGLRVQGGVWAVGFGVFLLLLAAAAISFRSRVSPREPWTTPQRGGGDPQWKDRISWIALAAVPSSLLLGVTSHISTDIAAVPLLWVIPLAIYLLTFVIAFSRRPILRHARVTWVFPHAVVMGVLLLIIESVGTLPAIFLSIHLAVFFVLALACHGELVQRRPPVQRLTEYYLWIAFGGVVGGSFNALAAPLIFDSIVEYPLAIVAACLLIRLGRRPLHQSSWRDVVWATALGGALVATCEAVVDRSTGQAPWWVVALVLLASCIVLFSFRRRTLRFAMGVAALLMGASLGLQDDDVLAQERGFFGVSRISLAADGPYHVLTHGRTVHGIQRLRSEFSREPLSYYHADGPVGRFFSAVGSGAFRRIGVIGLGTGSIACYAEPGQKWTFFEIDPTVDRLARESGYFTFLQQCVPEARVVLGDARVSLKQERSQFDLLVVDAFSSDAIPVHLLTLEALELYGRRITPDGLILLHISNNHLELAPIVARLVGEMGWAARIQRFVPEPARLYRLPSEWVVIGANDERLSFLDGDPPWRPLIEDARSAALWTDDHSDIVGALKWGRF